MMRQAIDGAARERGRSWVARLRTALDQDGFELLAELGVDLAQGFHIGRPRPPAEV